MIKKKSGIVNTYGGGNLVLRQPVEELLLVVGSVAHVGGNRGSQLLNKITLVKHRKKGRMK